MSTRLYDGNILYILNRYINPCSIKKGSVGKPLYELKINEPKYILD